MDISLPQNDPDPKARQKALQQARKDCTYDYQALPPLPMATKVPEDAGSSIEWTAEIAEALVVLTVNSHKIADEADATKDKYRGVGDSLTKDKNPVKRMFDGLSDMVKTAGLTGQATGIDDFKGLFIEVPRPRQTTTYLHDSTFGRMRLAGPAPLQIRRIGALDSRFPVTNAMYQASTGHEHDTLESAGAEGRLYLADYAALDGLPGGTFPSRQKYIAAPLALFAVQRGRGRHRPLVPIAIQLGQRPGSDNPIFTPADGPGWEVAKSFVQTADGNVHQAVHHLSHTHLVLEAVALATHRQLPPQHPLGSLLRLHMEGTLSINDGAVKSLICAGGGVDTVMAGRIDAVHDLIGKVVQAYRFDDAMLPRELEARGVADASALPEYPYRDDARLVWAAIHGWIEAYVRLYYAGSGDVLADTELQGWIGELVSRDGGRMQGVGQNGRIETIEYLIEALTHIVFTASAQHAAVNFPQLPIMSYAPAMPLAAYRPPPTSKAGITEQTYWDTLPPLDQANYQLVLGYLLGSINHTKLGKYPVRWGFNPLLSVATFLGAEPVGLYDARVEPLLNAFQKRLADVEDIIHERNASRAPYEFLLPSRIPQSINI
jgi:arachidonate 15-lipoxygenase